VEVWEEWVVAWEVWEEVAEEAMDLRALHSDLGENKD
jgi:hypothetical protein